MTTSPLRVLHLDSGREWRGGQRQVYLLARGQRDLGHEPLVIGAPNAPLIQRLRSAGLAAAGPARAAQFSVERMVRGTQAVYDAVLASASRMRRSL